MSAAETLVLRPPAREQVLRLETECGVQTFDLASTPRVSLGRHPSNDVHVRSRRVSSYHAEIRKEVDGLFLYDVGSTNGTLVNEESVTRKELRSGDRVNIGGFTITVRLVPRGAPGSGGNAVGASSFHVGTTGSLLPFRTVGPEAGAAKGAASDKEMDADEDMDTIESRLYPEKVDTSLPALLGTLARGSATVTIQVRTDTDDGRIYVIAGGVVHCELGSVSQEKALYRLLGLPKATYEILELLESETGDVPQTIQVPTDRLMVEGMQQVEALDKLSAKLPPPTSEVTLNERCAVAVNTLTADEVDVYQWLIRHQTLARVLEVSPMTDFMVMMVVHGLLQRGFFRAPETPRA